MPLYCFVCNSCGATVTHLRRVEERSEPVKCSCGCDMVRDYGAEGANAPGSEIGFRPYFDVGTGKYYQTRTERDADYKAKGLVPLTKRDVVDSIERGIKTRGGTLLDEKRRDAAWERAARKGLKRFWEKQRIVVR